MSGDVFSLHLRLKGLTMFDFFFFRNKEVRERERAQQGNRVGGSKGESKRSKEKGRGGRKERRMGRENGKVNSDVIDIEKVDFAC